MCPLSSGNRTSFTLTLQISQSKFLFYNLYIVLFSAGGPWWGEKLGKVALFKSSVALQPNPNRLNLNFIYLQKGICL